MITIVHVEDDPDIREIVSMALDMTGEFDLTQHASGKDALACVPDTPPDVLLLDVMMPGLTGFETLDLMRRTPGMGRVPAIFMTAHTSDPTLHTLCTASDVDVVHKPINPLTLGDRIKTMLATMH